LAAVICSAEPFQLMSGWGIQNGHKVRYETRLEPDGDRTVIKGWSGGVRIKDDRLYRVVQLRPKKIYFGYEVAVEAREDGRYDVRFAPLPAEMSDLGRQDLDEGWLAAPLPAYPNAQTVDNGEVIALDLMENPETGQRIVDYLTIGDDALRTETLDGPARDFTPEDAWIRIMEPLVTVDGEVIEPTRNFSGGISGAIAWIYTPSHGRYLLSLAPRKAQGFELGGEVRLGTMKIETGGSRIELNCSEPIATGKQAYNLYVLHQPAFRSPKSYAKFLMGSTSSLETLLR